MLMNPRNIEGGKFEEQQRRAWTNWRIGRKEKTKRIRKKPKWNKKVVKKK